MCTDPSVNNKMHCTTIRQAAIGAGESTQADRGDAKPGREFAPVTVAIATFNRAAYLMEALDSCAKQIVLPQQVIVIDDGSEDETARVVRDFTALDTVYVNAGRIGLGNARNLATALCRTKYICILDDDDIMLPGRVRDHMASFDRGAQMSHGGWINFQASGELEFRPGKNVSVDAIVYVGLAITHGACCYEAAVLREFPYRTDANGGVDFDVAARAILSEVSCGHTGSYVLLRRRHDASVSRLHGAGQALMRDVVVSTINRRRSDEEIAQRTRMGRAEVELATTQAPQLRKIYKLIGPPRRPLYVFGRVPRLADEFFARLVGMSVPWSEIQVVDEHSGLSGTVGLASRPTKSVQKLEDLCQAWRHQGIAPSIWPAADSGTVLSAMELAVETSVDCFRLILASTSLRELYLAFKIIWRQKTWEWYVAHKSSTSGGGTTYYLVSAQYKFSSGLENGLVHMQDSSAFIEEHTGLTPILVIGDGTSRQVQSFS